MYNQYVYQSMDSMRRSTERLNSSVENINNMFTVGYKSKRKTFHETISGMKEAQHRDFSTGTPKKSNRPLDFAIDGVGFFEVQLPDGTLAYTRNGAFDVNASGELISAQGYPITNKITTTSVDVNKSFDALEAGGKFDLSVLSKSITLPAGTAPDLDGSSGILRDQNGKTLGKILIANFPNPDGLKDVGNGLYVPTRESGEIEEVELGWETGSTKLKQGFVEAANVDIVKDMANIKQTETTMKAQMKVIRMLDQLQESLNSTLSRNI